MCNIDGSGTIINTYYKHDIVILLYVLLSHVTWILGNMSCSFFIECWFKYEFWDIEYYYIRWKKVENPQNVWILSRTIIQSILTFILAFIDLFNLLLCSLFPIFLCFFSCIFVCVKYKVFGWLTNKWFHSNEIIINKYPQILQHKWQKK